MPKMAFFAARGEVLLMSKEAESDRIRIYKTSDRSHVFLMKTWQDLGPPGTSPS